MSPCPYLSIGWSLAYAAADLAICRSGRDDAWPRCRPSDCPPCTVPLPIGNGEQRLNAAARCQRRRRAVGRRRRPHARSSSATRSPGARDRAATAAMTAAAAWRATATPRSGSPRWRWTWRARSGRGPKAPTVKGSLPASCSGCTWSASGERACPASRASCSTAGAGVRLRRQESAGAAAAGARRVDPHRARRVVARPAAGRAELRW